jgi:hypothetical protein
MWPNFVEIRSEIAQYVYLMQRAGRFWVRIPVGARDILHTHQVRPWGPPILLYSEELSLLSRVKQPGLALTTYPF